MSAYVMVGKLWHSFSPHLWRHIWAFLLILYLWDSVWAHWKESQVKITNMSLRTQKTPETLAEHTNETHTTHISTWNFKKCFSGMHIYKWRKLRHSVKQFDHIMYQEQQLNSDLLPQFSKRAPGASMPCFHMWNSKSVIERLCFP